MTLLFFTYADKNYSLFALPYVFFALKSNPGASVEISLEDFSGFERDNAEAIIFVNNLFPGRCLFRQSNLALSSPNILPNTIRFLETPETKCDYVYIGDIDLLVTVDVLSTWEQLCNDNNLPFGNVIRPKKKGEKDRLTGLHFISYNLYYPLPDLSDLNLSVESDEHVLYEIMRRKGVMVPVTYRNRPLCGVHASLNRDPLGRTTGPTRGEYKVPGLPWMGEGDNYLVQFLDLIKLNDFALINKYLSFEFKCILLVLEGLSIKGLRTLHRYAASYMLDKRLLVSEDTINIKDAKKVFRELRKVSFSDAEIYGFKMHQIWPSNISVLLMLYRHYIDAGNYSKAALFGLHMSDSPEGYLYLKENDVVLNDRSKLEGAGDYGIELLNVFSINN